MAVSPVPVDTFPRPLRIAVLEDDAELRECILVPGLADCGFEVTGTGTAAELYRSMLTRSFDIVVLDVGLPDEDGLTVARNLRAISNMGIVMLTANQGKHDRVHALTVGADAYLAKPIDIEVLGATLHSLARRLASTPAITPAPPATLPWHLDTDDWRLVSPSGATLQLSAPERALLRVLLEAHGQPVTREALIAALSSDVYDFDPHRLEMLIHRLRRKAADGGMAALPLLTARNRGYLFVSQP